MVERVFASFSISSPDPVGFYLIPVYHYQIDDTGVTMIDASENQILMWAFDFTADDLDANRAGTLTDAQIAKLPCLRRPRLVRQLFTLVIVLVIITSAIVGDFSSIFRGIMLLILVISTPSEVRKLLRIWVGFNRDQRNGQVSSIEGDLYCLPKAYSLIYTKFYRVSINGEEFEVTRRQSDELHQVASAKTPPYYRTTNAKVGKVRLYFTPRSRIPVSVELIDKKRLETNADSSPNN
jgi:hypothetical protein